MNFLIQKYKEYVNGYNTIKYNICENNDRMEKIRNLEKLKNIFVIPLKIDTKKKERSKYSCLDIVTLMSKLWNFEKTQKNLQDTDPPSQHTDPPSQDTDPPSQHTDSSSQHTESPFVLYEHTDSPFVSPEHNHSSFDYDSYFERYETYFELYHDDENKYLEFLYR